MPIFFTINVVYLRFPSGNLFYLSTELMSKEKRLNQKTKPVQSLFFNNLPELLFN